MEVRRIGWLIVLAALLTTGCRKQQFLAAYVETLNNSNRELEDQINDLEYELEVLKQTNEDLRRQNEQMRGGKRSSGSPAAGSSTGPKLLNPGRRPPAMTPDEDDLKPPVIETPKETESSPLPMKQELAPPARPMVDPVEPRQPAVEQPKLEIRQPAADPEPPPRLETNPSRRSNFQPPPTEPEDLPKPDQSSRAPLRPALTTPPREPTSLQQPLPSFAPPARARPESVEAPPAPPAEELPLPKPPETQTSLQPIELQKTSIGPVTKIHLNPLHTGGEDTDGQPGDEGISLLLEPQNSAGEFVAEAGNVSVVVLDPQLDGTAARVARWDFPANQVRDALKSISTRRGIHLHMAWKDKRPQNHRLQLYVRLETADGRKLQTDREIFVTLPGEISDRWTPRRGETAAEIARQPRTTLAEPAPTTVPREEVAPMPAIAPTNPVPADMNKRRQSSFAPADSATANEASAGVTPITEPAAAAVPPAEATQPAISVPSPAPIPSRTTPRPKSKLIVPPPALGETP